MRLNRTQLSWLLAVWVHLAVPAVIPAEVTDPAELLPESCVVYAELQDPPALLATILDHPLRKEVEATPQFTELRKNPEFQKLQIGLRLVEFKLQKLWRPALETATRHGVAVGFDAATEGAVVLVRAEDEAFLKKLRHTFLEFVRNDAKENDRADPVAEHSYRGVAAYQMDQVAFAVSGDWLVLTNKGDLGKAVLDRLLGDEAPSLASSDDFQRARDAAAEDRTAWAWLHLAPLRQKGLVAGLFRGHAEDFGGEVIVGGGLAALAEAPYLAATLQVDPSGIQLSASVPVESARLAEEAGYFYGADGGGAAPPAIPVDNRVVSIRTYRNLVDLWLRGPDLFDDLVNAQMTKAESDLSTLAGGRSFVEDILGALGPQMQLVAALQDYEAADVPEPAIKLPGFAALFMLRDPDESQRLFKLAYQQVVGFINLNAGQQGYPPLDLNSERKDGVLLVSATYFREDLERYAAANAMDGAARLQANFSPTAAFVGDYFILSSTRELATEIVDNLAQPSEQPESATVDEVEGNVNTALELQADVIRAILTQNREHLVNQNMLEEGNDRESAEQEIDGLLAMLGWLDRAGVQLSLGEKNLNLSVELQLR